MTRGYTIFDHAQFGHTVNVNRQVRRVMAKTPDSVLYQTWLRHRTRFNEWPLNFETSIEDPLIRASLEALHRADLPAIQRRPSPPVADRRRPYRDGKSAAANDRDD